jgi:NADPH2:quinone reductase
MGKAVDVLQVGEQPDPEPEAGEVRVQLIASGVNPVDVKRRGGTRGSLDTSSVIPHFDGAGVIDRIGAGVSESRIGERVWVYEAQWQRNHGTAAEFVTLPASLAIKLSDSIGFAEAASLGIPAMTAHRCVFVGSGDADQTVLVTGGAGAVGGYAIQFAKQVGAQVITTVSTEEKAAVCRQAGADHVIDYKTEDVKSRIMEITDGEGVDRIVEVAFGANLNTSLEVLKENGTIAAYASDLMHEPKVPFYRLMYSNITVHHVLVFGMPKASKQAAVDDITSGLELGRLSAHLGQRFPLEQIAAAHEEVERGSLGKVILEIESHLI